MRNELPPLECDTEAYLKARVKALGGECLKFVSPGTAGVCDRLLLLPNGVTAFVELKRLGEAPTALQDRFIRRCHTLGHNAFVASTVAAVEGVLLNLEFEMGIRQMAEEVCDD